MAAEIGGRFGFGSRVRFGIICGMGLQGKNNRVALGLATLSLVFSLHTLGINAKPEGSPCGKCGGQDEMRFMISDKFNDEERIAIDAIPDGAQLLFGDQHRIWEYVR